MDIDNNDLLPTKNKTNSLGTKLLLWKNVFTKNIYSKNAKIKNLTVDNINIKNQKFYGTQGQQGPALFTLVNTLNPVYSLTPNSIITNNNNESIVRTVENYYTAFITCIVNSGSPTIGFTSISNLNTMSYNFRINPSNDNNTTCSIAFNGGGNIGEYDYTYGQVLTIALTSMSCKFFINGFLIYTSSTEQNYLNVYGWFYINNSCNISNIAYGFLNDPSVG